jgi:hypothetical protein
LRANRATSSGAHGSSNKWDAPDTIISCFSQRELRERLPVKFNDLAIFFADDQQGWSPNPHQRHVVSKVGTPAARYDGAHRVGPDRCSSPRCRGAGAGAEIANRKTRPLKRAGPCAFAEPRRPPDC